MLKLEIDVVFVCLGDMPVVVTGYFNCLIADFDSENDRAIGVFIHNAKRGNPVLWVWWFFEDM